MQETQQHKTKKRAQEQTIHQSTKAYLLTIGYMIKTLQPVMLWWLSFKKEKWTISGRDKKLAHMNAVEECQHFQQSQQKNIPPWCPIQSTINNHWWKQWSFLVKRDVMNRSLMQEWGVRCVMQNNNKINGTRKIYWQPTYNKIITHSPLHSKIKQRNDFMLTSWKAKKVLLLMILLKSENAKGMRAFFPLIWISWTKERDMSLNKVQVKNHYKNGKIYGNLNFEGKVQSPK